MLIIKIKTARGLVAPLGGDEAGGSVVVDLDVARSRIQLLRQIAVGLAAGARVSGTAEVAGVFHAGRCPYGRTTRCGLSRIIRTCQDEQVDGYETQQ